MDFEQLYFLFYRIFPFVIISFFVIYSIIIGEITGVLVASGALITSIFTIGISGISAIRDKIIEFRAAQSGDYGNQYDTAHCNILTFEVVKGLVSNESVKGEYLFNKYVNTLFAEKAQQDILKLTNEHNPAYRETIKLFLNAVTGKFVENVDLYEDNVLLLKQRKTLKALERKRKFH